MTNVPPTLNTHETTCTDSGESQGVCDLDFKLATLFSIFESTPEEILRKALLDADGDLEQAIPLILSIDSKPLSRDSSANDDPAISDPTSQKHKSSTPEEPNTLLPSLNDRLRWKEPLDDLPSSSSALPTRPPKPLVLYNPADVEKNCPCTLLFNVLDKDLAGRLLQVMLKDSETWNRNRWWLFERIVESPHKTSYFAEEDEDLRKVSSWTYNGTKQDAPRRFLPEMKEAKLVVRRIVNDLRKMRTIHPYEVQGDWNCNVAAVNHYAHSKESVAWHADKLTYLGPRPTIASLSLGATRFFRIRKVVPDAKNPDTAGQLISIALPHNSLCIMWPPMQEEWKHEIPPQATITPHPISGSARINITFRVRREGFSSEETPVCKCGVAMVLRCVFKNQANYGRYFYMCYGAGSQEGRSCGAFHWVDMEEKLKLVSSRPEDATDDEKADKGSNDEDGLTASSQGFIGNGSSEIGDHELDLADELSSNDFENLPIEAVSDSEQQE
ncbi:hypothetical protein BGZ98_004552 [Dissophora globulifera]|nr:hypothetical protein BGZ98_004552 [Dissophora globulifera]